MKHHTKDKGDIGVGMVIANLLANNIQVAIPISEHLPFDLIAISQTATLKRISVKHRILDGKGQINISFASSWADKLGTHRKRHNLNHYDCTAVYCPNKNECYYIRNDECNQSFTLRFDNPKNNQLKGIKIADNYTNPNRIF